MQLHLKADTSTKTAGPNISTMFGPAVFRFYDKTDSKNDYRGKTDIRVYLSPYSLFLFQNFTITLGFNVSPAFRQARRWHRPSCSSLQNGPAWDMS
jgi:hypothetical protein